MSAKDTKRTANTFVLLAILGVWCAFMYVMFGSMVCTLPKEHDTRKQDQYAECIAKGHLTEFSCLEFFNSGSNQQPREQTTQRHEYKFGSWPKDLFCETKASDIVIALLTYGLILVGAFQAYWLKKTVDTAADTSEKQAADMQASIEATLKNAEAANKQATAIIHAERPYVFLGITSTGIEMTSNGAFRFAAERLKFDFWNYGKTPALLNEFMELYPVVEGVEAPPPVIDPMKQRGRMLPVGTVSGPTIPYALSTNLMTVTDVTRLMEPNAWKDRRLFFQGFIRFSDTFGNHYITGFLAVSSPIHGAWALRGDEEYNYTRIERPEDIPPHPDYAEKTPRTGN